MTEKPKKFRPLGLSVDGVDVKKVGYMARPADDVLAWMEANAAHVGHWLIVLVRAETPADAPQDMQRMVDAARDAGADAVAYDTVGGAIPPGTTTIMVRQG
jgi:methylmalonyl-CoA mutase cobalamin-binding subunit